MQWEFHYLHPKDMMNENEILYKKIIKNKVEISLAGSIGKKKNVNRKPGLQEDGGMVALSTMLHIYLLIDAHYEKDITEILLDLMEEEIDQGLWNNLPSSDSLILERTLTYVENARIRLTRENAIGEASFCVLTYHPEEGLMRYFMVGDLMIFANNPLRRWGASFQVGNRHFYEWLNADRLMGYHFGRVPLEKDTRLIITTDGLIDKPSIPHSEIEKLFHFQPFNARVLALYALETVSYDEDDNIAIFCLQFNTNMN